MSNNSGSSLFAFVVGALTGAAIGILYAPDKGSNTRDRLTYRLQKYKQTLEDLLEDLMSDKNGSLSEAKTHGEKVVNDARVKAEHLLKDVDQLLNQIKKTDNN
jgi:gas vesicle protein